MFSNREYEGNLFSENAHLLARNEPVDPANGRNPEQQALWLLQKQIIESEFPLLKGDANPFVPSYVACGGNAEEIRANLKKFEAKQIALNAAIAERSAKFNTAAKLRAAGKPVPRHLL